jgi:predicted ArsR family transcriptional regulator
MLRKLLDEIQSGGTLEPGELAARLGTTPQMVRGMLEHLERMGRLQSFSACSLPGCEGCGLTGTCTPKNGGGRVWQLTH